MWSDETGSWRLSFRDPAAGDDGERGPAGKEAERLRSDIDFPRIIDFQGGLKGDSDSLPGRTIPDRELRRER